MKYVTVGFILVLISLAVFVSGCEEGLSPETLNPKEDSKLPEKLSLEEARKEAGFEIITPEYLPEGYAFNYSIVYDNNDVTPEGQDARIVILNYQKGNESLRIKETVYESKWGFGRAEITIYPSEPEENNLMESAEKISINGRDGKYLDAQGDLKALQLELEGVEITLRGSLEKTEMLKIAESLDPFTEFYILGPEGKADNYPTEYIIGQNGTVVVGIVNHEYRPVNYTLEIKIENASLPENLKQVTLAHNETWEKPVTITPPFEGTNMNLEFLLFKETDRDIPYRDLRLWINVSENISEAK